MKNIMHVSILDSSNSRKNVLTSAVSAIQCLKDFERVIVIRKQKRIYKNELMNNLNKINQLFAGLNIPKVDYEDKQIIKKLKDLPKEKGALKPKVSKVHRLEDDLRDLKQKIATL